VALSRVAVAVFSATSIGLASAPSTTDTPKPSAAPAAIMLTITFLSMVFESSDSAALAATTRWDLFVLKGANCTAEVGRNELLDESLDASPLAGAATTAEVVAAKAVEVAIVLEFLTN
jgi:hypothetical protein